MGLAKNFFSQTRKPEGFLGKMMLGTMNSGHAKLADWGFTHLPELTPESAVDLGWGRRTERRGIIEKISESTRDRGRLFRFVRSKGQGVQQDNDHSGLVRSPLGGCVEFPVPR